LMADHLHPSIEGQALLGETVARAVAEANLLPGANPDAPIPPREELAHVLGVNALELTEVYGRMASLFEKPPLGTNNAQAAEYLWGRSRGFVERPGEVEQRTIERWNKSVRGGGRTPSISYLAGQTALDAGEYLRAAQYFAAAQKGMTPFGVSRLRAGCLSLLALAQEGALTEAGVRMLRRSLGEAVYVELLAEEEELGRLYTTVGGLWILAGDEEAGRAALKKGFERGFELGNAEALMLQHVVLSRSGDPGKKTPPVETSTEGESAEP